MIKQKLLPIIHTKINTSNPYKYSDKKIPIHHTMTLEEIIKPIIKIIYIVYSREIISNNKKI